MGAQIGVEMGVLSWEFWHGSSEMGVLSMGVLFGEGFELADEHLMGVLEHGHHILGVL